LSLWISNIRNLAIVYFGVLVIAAGVVGGFLYLAYQSNAYIESKAAIEADIQGFVDIYNISRSSEALQHALAQRLKSRDISSFYMLLDAKGKWLAGNIKALPTEIEYQDNGFVIYDVPYGDVIGNVPEERDLFYPHYDVMIKSVTLGGDDPTRAMTLMVGRDVDAFQTAQSVIIGLSWITAGIVIMMTAIGFFMVSMILQRVRLIQHTATRVIETGNLSSRIPETQASGDFKRLADTLNHMLARIEESMAEIRQVSDDIAHDLRTPLTRLTQHVEALKTGSTHVSIHDVAEEAERMASIFNALLRISNIEHGKRSAGFGDIDLRTFLEDLHEYYSLLMPEKGQRFVVELPSVLPSIHGDKDMLFQAFSNIIENAMKYTPAGGTIALKAATKGERIEISIIDNGPGIGDADKPKIFCRFFRTDDSRHSPGNGLGLALVKAVMDLHQASIMLGDNNPSGLIITVSLKCAEM
jgi:signal transduction histidine kinase